MTNPASPPPPDATDQVAEAVRALLPALRKTASSTLLVIVAAIVVSGGAAVILMRLRIETEDRLKMTMFALIAGVCVVVFAYRSMIRRQEAMVMPILAQAVGFSYDKTAKPFVDGLPPRLLPAKAVHKGEDHVQGTLGAHAIQMAEVHVETGGKNSSTLFKGLVVQFRNRRPMPAFFLAPPNQTRRAMFGSWIDASDLNHLRDLTSPSGKTYGLWTSTPASEEPPGLSLAVEGVLALDRQLSAPVSLFTATSNNGEMHIALSHKRNLYRVGGLFPKADSILADVQKAASDLSIVLSIAQQLIALEERVSANTAIQDPQ